MATDLNYCVEVTASYQLKSLRGLQSNIMHGYGGGGVGLGDTATKYN